MFLREFKKTYWKGIQKRHKIYKAIEYYQNKLLVPLAFTKLIGYYIVRILCYQTNTLDKKFKNNF